MKQQKRHKRINSPFIRVLLRTVQILLNIFVILLSASRKHTQTLTTTSDDMEELATQDPTLFDSYTPPRHRTYDR
jgi:hypothetical protein